MPENSKLCESSILGFPIDNSISHHWTQHSVSYIHLRWTFQRISFRFVWKFTSISSVFRIADFQLVYLPKFFTQLVSQQYQSMWSVQITTLTAMPYPPVRLFRSVNTSAKHSWSRIYISASTMKLFPAHMYVLVYMALPECHPTPRITALQTQLSGTLPFTVICTCHQPSATWVRRGCNGYILVGT